MNKDLAEIIVEACVKKGWSLNWDHRGAYLFLEATELIEAIRGKGGDPVKEAADTLFTLIALLESNKIDLEDVIDETKRKAISLLEE